ncbi:hypothetical protein [Novosphingobium sp. MMS21-SN21R]|uniref:hypothetical protein n=1 Tax=Novosphingobium sp. MMS21-SN21R TaxID=2969298 RepID=UPI002887073C|nr:hypothetical protein [Novosphingobium sp. MMS21-SN21R]MDT0507517.1 hypothetical protein [Novosphingobium sp. MMS21-SN21R]
MTRQSTAKRPVFSAFTILEAVGNDLALLKSEDRLTYADIGRVLGKSEDMAAKYCAGEADMGLVSYAAGKREWNGRFTGSLERLCVESRPSAIHGRTVQSKILKAALALGVALEDDNEIDGDEIKQNRPAIEEAIAALQSLLEQAA